jgi:hypothetical protein
MTSSSPLALVANAIGELRNALNTLERAGSVEAAEKVREALAVTDREFMRLWEGMLRATGRLSSDPGSQWTNFVAARLYVGDI